MIIVYYRLDIRISKCNYAIWWRICMSIIGHVYKDEKVKMKKNKYKRKQDYIVDREVEARTIADEIESNAGSRVRFIYSATATGKSTLSEKVIAFLDHSNTFRIKTLNKNKRNNTLAGEYFCLLFKKVYSSLKSREGYSLEYYIKNKLDKNIQKELISCYLEQWATRANMFTVLFTGIFYFIQKFFNIGFFDLNNIISGNSLLSKKIQYHYIVYVLSALPCVIIIENFQNIDRQSFDEIINCIDSTKAAKNYYIFEYTLSENTSMEDLENMKDLLADCGVEIKLMELCDLDSAYLPDFIENHFETNILSENFNTDLQNFYAHLETGNLREVIDFTLNYDGNLSYGEEGETLKLIQGLSQIEIMLLFTIIYVNEKYSEEQLIDFWAQRGFSEKNQKNALKVLTEYRLIDYTENRITISHASILDICMNNRELFEDINSMTYNNLKNYYMSVWKNSNLLDAECINVWDIILQLFYYNKPEELWTLFENIKNNVFLVLTPETAWLYINSYFQRALDIIIEDQEKISTILNLCFEFELYKEGYSLFSQIETKKELEACPILIIYKSMYLSALDCHEENIKFYNHYIQLVEVNSNIAFNLGLIALSSYRSLALETNWFNLYYELMNNDTYKDMPEYGYLLRLSDMYFDRQSSIKYIKKSISFFKKRNFIHQSGKSMITAAHTYAGLGKKRIALWYIKSAEKQLKDKIMGKHMLLVNKAVIYLLMNRKDKLIWAYLDEANLTAVVPFDKLAIIVNKLAWKISNKDCSNVQLLINQGERYTRLEPDKHIHALFYYNAYYLFSVC